MRINFFACAGLGSNQQCAPSRAHGAIAANRCLYTGFERLARSASLMAFLNFLLLLVVCGSACSDMYKT